MPVEIVALTDTVLIEGQEVRRPDSVSRSEWLEFWDAVKSIGEPDDDEMARRLR